MPTHLIVAPAAFGKTRAMLELCRRATAGADGGPRTQPLLCVASATQRESAHRRLAQMGGALGVRVLTFDDLYSLILRGQRSGRTATELGEPVLFRLMRDIVEELEAAGRLEHFGALAAMPGFLAATRELILELKAARIPPEQLEERWVTAGAPARLRDLARIYAEWQARLTARRWADRTGTGWLALEALRDGRAPLDPAHTPVVFDGFDSFTQIQLEIIAALQANAPDCGLYVTLTGDLRDEGSEPARRAHRRFHRTRLRLQERLACAAEVLPAARPLETWPPALLHLQQTLFEPPGSVESPGEAVTFVEASSRALEVRAALRWIKEQVIVAGAPLEECAVVARSIDPYLPHLFEIAEEFGIPLRPAGGLPLRDSPPVEALMSMLRAFVPQRTGQPLLPRRTLVELWRSPYFDWTPLGIQPGDADLLDAVARAGLVVGGLQQWREAFALLGGVQGRPRAEAGEEVEPAAESPRGAQLARLRAVFEAFIKALSINAVGRVADHAALLERWLGDDALTDADAAREVDDDAQAGEQEIGEDAPRAGAPDAGPHAAISLGLFRQAALAEPNVAARDRAALLGLRRLVRGLAWAARALETPAVPFGDFVRDLGAAVEAARVELPAAQAGALFVGGLMMVRGLPLQALAVLGMAEGEIPARVVEDVLVRDDERAALQLDFPGLNLRAESAEYELFLDAVTRPGRRLLLTRPRLAEDGAEWEPSAFWQEVRSRLGEPEPRQVRWTTAVAPAHAASPAELAAALSSGRPVSGALDVPAGDFAAETGERLAAITRATKIIEARSRDLPTPFDGDLSGIADNTEARFGPSFVWSPTALETWRACGFHFLIGRALRLEPRPEPEAGPNAAQTGSIYHSMLERTYTLVGRERGDFGDAATLLRALHAVAPPLLRSAPRDLGFRAPPWWPALQEELLETAAQALATLATLGGEPVVLEASFGGKEPLLLEAEGGVVAVRGVIDRLDRMGVTPDGKTLLHVIDYKSGVGELAKADSLSGGKKLQLGLYAAAAQQIVAEGVVTDGFYFFVRKGERARWGLADYPGGVEAAIADTARFAGEAALGARAGHFTPRPPEGGCPNYCPAASFCHHYAPRFAF